MSWGWILLVVVLVALFGVYLSATAGRLDRLHKRVDSALASLDVQLLRRTGAVLDVANSGLLDPVGSLVLADAAVAARDASGSPLERAQLESDLTKALTTVLGDDEDIHELCRTRRGTALVDTLGGAVHRTAISRRFYNDAVRATRAVRRQRLVRLFRLAGHTEWPQTCEMDDTIPPGLETR